MESNSAVLVRFTSVLYNRKAAIHPCTRRSSRLVTPTSSLRPVRMSHDWTGGIVPPRRCMHQEAVNPPLPAVCLRLLFPAKQTTRFPMRASRPPHSVLSGHALRAPSQMKTFKTSFFKKKKKVCLCRGASESLYSAQLLAQNERVCDKSTCRSCLSLLWINVLIHFADKQLCSNFILIHLWIHASTPTTPRPVEKEPELL